MHLSTEESQDSADLLDALDVDPAALLDRMRSEFRFPSADLVAAAAGMFRPAPDGRDRAFHYHWAEVRSDGSGRRHVAAGVGDWFHSSAEGVFPFLELAPGMVRFGRVDPSRADRARAGAGRHLVGDELSDVRWSGGAPDLRNTEVEFDADYWASVPDDDEEPARGAVTSWSRKSQARMMRTIRTLDLSALVAGDELPAMVTLTLPGDWLAVAPDAATAAAAFHRFCRAWSKKWGSPLAGIWKREFQRRGAPHWHLWTVPPLPEGGPREFRDWLSLAWTRALKVDPTTGPDHKKSSGISDGKKCTCSEWCKSLSAGTGVDYAEALRARDPQRLSVYFLKESLGGEDKAYQNHAPAEWAGQSLGRFWGVRGLEKVTATVPVHPGQQYALWRVLRRVREASAGARSVPVSRVDTRSGVVRSRRVNRRVRVRSAAGWVGVNDGAALGMALARFLDLDAGHDCGPSIFTRSGRRDASTFPSK